MDSSALTPDPRIYVRILTYIRDQIRDGTLHPGQPTPTISALTERFSCTRQTVSKALDLLTQDGDLALYPGLGYYVAPADGLTPRRETNETD